MRERLAPDAVHVWVARLDAPAQPFAAMLGRDEHERAAALATPALRRRFVVRRGVRRTILAAYAGRRPEELRFTEGAAGRPALVGAELDFSCSSSHDVAVIAVTRGRRVGVDVERRRPVARALAIAHDLLGNDDALALRSLAGPERDAAFLRAWTRLEARVKGSGDGLAQRSTDARVWSVRALDLAPGYVCAVAADDPRWRAVVRAC